MKKILVVMVAFVMVMMAFAMVVGTASAEKKGNAAHLYLYEKQQEYPWGIIEGGAWGKMKYYPEGETFDFVFNGHGLEAKTDYSLIYWHDYEPWDITVIDGGTSNKGGNIHLADSYDFGHDLDDDKIWLVPSDDINEAQNKLSDFRGEEHLWENNPIDFIDTDA